MTTEELKRAKSLSASVASLGKAAKPSVRPFSSYTPSPEKQFIFETPQSLASKLNSLPEGSLGSHLIKEKLSAKEVIDEIKKLSGNDRLDISNIRNGEVLARAAQRQPIDTNDMRWHGSGGASQLVSANSMAMEIPVGSVNGSNTVFTVKNIPLFMDVSGQLMVSSTQDPTNYGFTITGSLPLYTITFLNPPSGPSNPQTPHSFYNLTTAAATNLSSYFETDSFIATANQTVFTTTLIPVFVFSFTLQGQLLTNNVDYTQSGSTFTLTSGAIAGNAIVISYLHA